MHSEYIIQIDNGLFTYLEINTQLYFTDMYKMYASAGLHMVTHTYTDTHTYTQWQLLHTSNTDWPILTCIGMLTHIN